MDAGQVREAGWEGEGGNVGRELPEFQSLTSGLNMKTICWVMILLYIPQFELNGQELLAWGVHEISWVGSSRESISKKRNTHQPESEIFCPAFQLQGPRVNCHLLEGWEVEREMVSAVRSVWMGGELQSDSTFFFHTHQICSTVKFILLLEWTTCVIYLNISLKSIVI